MLFGLNLYGNISGKIGALGSTVRDAEAFVAIFSPGANHTPLYLY